MFVAGDEITGVLDWSEAGQGDALYDLAILTLGHEEHLGDVVTGYDADIDLDVNRAWWSWRSLMAIRWLAEHGFDPFLPGCEVDVLRSHFAICAHERHWRSAPRRTARTCRCPRGRAYARTCPMMTSWQLMRG